MGYTSLQRSFRGFNFHRDYATMDHFIQDMKLEEDSDGQIDWAVLYTIKGVETLEYRRGSGIFSFASLLTNGS